jgi:hypothetical protein
MNALLWVLAWLCHCCLAKDVEVTLLKTASNQNPLNRLVNFYVPFNNRRAIVRYQSLYTAADLKQAGMSAGYTIDTIALRVASPANTFDAAILNNVRWAYQWLGPSTISSYTQLQPGSFTYTFKYQVTGCIMSLLPGFIDFLCLQLPTVVYGPSPLSTTALTSNAQVEFDVKDFAWDGTSHLLLEFSMQSDRDAVLSNGM